MTHGNLVGIVAARTYLWITYRIHFDDVLLPVQYSRYVDSPQICHLRQHRLSSYKQDQNSHDSPTAAALDDQLPLRTPYVLSTVVLVVGVVLTAGPVGSKKAAVEAAGPTSSGPRRGRRPDRPGADRSDVKSALVTSRTGCATAGAAATAGILAVRDGQVASHHRCHSETLWQSVLQQEQGQQSVIGSEKHLSLGAVICDLILTGLLTHTCTHIHTLADTLLVFVFCTSIGDVVFSVA